MSPVLAVLMLGCNQAEPTGVFGVPNIDDDDGDGRRDWANPNPEDDELSSFPFQPRRRAHQLRLAVDSDAVRVWFDGRAVIDGGGSATIPVDGEPILLGVEFRDPNVDTSLVITQLDRRGKQLGADPDRVPLMSSPMLLNHHLQPAVSVKSVNIPGFTDPLVRAYRQRLDDRYDAADGSRYGYDVWMQDEIEFVTMHGRDGVTGLVIDSIRDRGLDAFPEAELVGPQMGRLTRGSRNQATSQDSFGNLETTPPVTVGDLSYPYGRIYYGESAGRGIDPRLVDYLESNGMQAPFTLDVSWLCVGHVDEFVSFVPDRSSPKGFRVALADTRRAWELLEALPPERALPQYLADFGIDSVADMVDSAELRVINDEIQRLYLDTTKQRLIDELGLLEDDFIYIPDIYEPTPGCFGRNAALIPGMVNLVVDNPRGGPSRLFLADPFIRSDLSDQDGDPFIQEVRRIMPAEHELVFVNIWEAYHVNLGEVHCATNVTREPHEVPWWPVDGQEVR